MIRLKLEKLAKANYRNTLKRQAFKKLQVHFVSRQADKEATEYYISKLLSRMIKNWRLTVNRMLQYKHDLLLERKKAYLRERLHQYTQLKYSAICFYHWKQLYNHVTAEKAKKAKAFLKLALPAVKRIIKRDAFTEVILYAKAVKLDSVQQRNPETLGHSKTKEEVRLPS